MMAHDAPTQSGLTNGDSPLHTATGTGSRAQTQVIACCWPDCSTEHMVDGPLCLVHLQDAASLMRAFLRYEQQARNEQTDGVIYYLQVGSRIKIGWTSDMHQRMRAYPPDSTLLAAEQGSMADERDMHRTCRPYRTHGREWYEPCDAMFRFVEAAKERESKRVAAAEAAEMARIRAIPRPPKDAPIKTLDGTRGWNEPMKRAGAPVLRSGTHGNVGR